MVQCKCTWERHILKVTEVFGVRFLCALDRKGPGRYNTNVRGKDTYGKSLKSWVLVFAARPIERELGDTIQMYVGKTHIESH